MTYRNYTFPHRKLKAGILVLVILAASPFVEHKRRALFLLGDWKVPEQGTTLTFKSDNSFVVRNRIGQKRLTGTYSLTGIRCITFHNEYYYDDNGLKKTFDGEGVSLNSEDGLSSIYAYIPIWGNKINYFPLVNRGEKTDKSERVTVRHLYKLR